MAVPEHGEPLPHQLSCSWGFSADAASSNNFVRFAMQGQSFFLATGDGGAFPTQSGDASSNEHAEPDITQVGGTELTNSGGYWSAEGVWNNPSEGGQFASAGGYYTSMPIPDYQAGISMTANKGSPLHRNAPDVAMVADQILVILTVYSTNGVASPGTEWTSWGTSFAAPLWAGFNALVNQQATAQGKPRDGFINPALYAIASGSDYTKCFHDITVGNNTWSNSPNLFYAEPGYDLCTGLGSPTGTNLINALMGYAGPTFVDFNFAGAVQDGDYNDPFSTLARGTNAVSTSGTVIIKTAGTSSETMTIKKPMTITAVGGGATVGN
jgi:kumamolisin